jgi:hypothetical protein
MFAAIKTVLEQYGFGAAMAAFVAFLLYYVLRYVQRTQDKIMDQAIKREDSQRAILGEYNKELKTQRKQSKKYHLQEMKDHEKITEGLNEVVKSLGRINGYKTH